MSDKSIEITKVNEKKNEEEEKRINKAETVARMEQNKVTAEKLADKIKKNQITTSKINKRKK